MTTPPESLVAFIADGEDSFVAVQIGGVWHPLVFARPKDPEYEATIERAVKNIVLVTGKTIRKYEFGVRRELAVYKR